MVFLYIYLALWVVTFTYAVYESNRGARRLSILAHSEFLGIKTKEPMWFLLLLSIIIAPIGPIIILIDWVRSRFFSPRNKTPQNLSPQETIHCAEKLPENIYTEVSIACAQALSTNQWEQFAQYLTEQTTFRYFDTEETMDCLFELRQISDQIHIMHLKGDLNNISVETCKFHAKTCVVINPRKQPDKHYLLFRIIDGKITHIVYTPVTVKRGIRYNPFEDLPWAVEFLSNRSYDDAESLKNHLPCFVCGTPSEQLQWRRLSLKNTQNVIDGVTSICPHCNRQVEYYIETQTEIPQPKHDENKDLPF